MLPLASNTEASKISMVSFHRVFHLPYFLMRRNVIHKQLCRLYFLEFCHCRKCSGSWLDPVKYNIDNICRCASPVFVEAVVIASYVPTFLHWQFVELEIDVFRERSVSHDLTHFRFIVLDMHIFVFRN